MVLLFRGEGALPGVLHSLETLETAVEPKERGVESVVIGS